MTRAGKPVWKRNDEWLAANSWGAVSSPQDVSPVSLLILQAVSANLKIWTRGRNSGRSQKSSPLERGVAWGSIMANALSGEWV